MSLGKDEYSLLSREQFYDMVARLQKGGFRQLLEADYVHLNPDPRGNVSVSSILKLAGNRENSKVLMNDARFRNINIQLTTMGKEWDSLISKADYDSLISSIGETKCVISYDDFARIDTKLTGDIRVFQLWEYIQTLSDLTNMKHYPKFAALADAISSTSKIGVITSDEFSALVRRINPEEGISFRDLYNQDFAQLDSERLGYIQVSRVWQLAKERYEAQKL